MRRGAILFLLLFACLERVPKVAPEKLAALRQASGEEAMKDCKELGRFKGYSSQPGDKGLAQARTEARAKCAESGATDYYYDKESFGPDAIEVSAKAYDCGAGK
ncbi:MAG TPA: hypothetical protein VMK66_02895 [Myxococcales bacterium]|nr:hypothetical protein [Myxococcales bacterium]